MDIVNRLTLKIANDPRGDWAVLATEARHHIESLRTVVEALTLRRAELESVLQLIATPKRSDGTYNYCREACEKLAKDVL